MARQNRVWPTGEVVAHPARGLFMGNRGCLHDAEGRLGAARWRHRAWITCALSFKGRRRDLMAPGRYTELFFLDEAVAAAAGHRPCAECRRPAWAAFTAAWATCFGPMRAPEIDRALHAARVKDRVQRRHLAGGTALPDGAMVLIDGAAHLIWQGKALRWQPEGYGKATPIPRGPVTVLTPEPIIATLRAGWQPVLHPSAGVGAALE